MKRKKKPKDDAGKKLAEQLCTGIAAKGSWLKGLRASRYIGRWGKKR